MNNEVHPDVIKKTQDLLGPYISKPPLTTKLLNKPPFRFLHDIISSVVRETGFLRECFSDRELNFENMKDKINKIKFLQKFILSVESFTGIVFFIKPSKIIAGLEPTRTNELLQQLGKLLLIHEQSLNTRGKPSTHDTGITSILKEPMTRQFNEGKNVYKQNINEDIIENENLTMSKHKRTAMPFVRPSSARPAPPKIQIKFDVIQRETETTREARLTVFNNEYEVKPSESNILKLNTEIDIFKNQYKNFNPMQVKVEKNLLSSSIFEYMNDCNYKNLDRRNDFKETESDNNIVIGSVIRTIYFLRMTIQESVSAANPLGKLTNFIQENIEAMQTEYFLWFKLNRAYNSKIQSQKIKAGHSNEKIELSIYELFTLEKKEKQKIQKLKSELTKYSCKIKKLLNE